MVCRLSPVASARVLRVAPSRRAILMTRSRSKTSSAAWRDTNAAAAAAAPPRSSDGRTASSSSSTTSPRWSRPSAVLVMSSISSSQLSGSPAVRLEGIDQHCSDSGQDRGPDGEFPASRDRVQGRLHDCQQLERLGSIERDEKVLGHFSQSTEWTDPSNFWTRFESGQTLRMEPESCIWSCGPSALSQPPRRSASIRR